MQTAVATDEPSQVTAVRQARSDHLGVRMHHFTSPVAHAMFRLCQSFGVWI